jgi:hypothetical protein
MENRTRTRWEEPPETPNRRPGEAQPIGEILEELLAQYQARFPGIHLTIVESPVNAL